VNTELQNLWESTRLLRDGTRC